VSVAPLPSEPRSRSCPFGVCDGSGWIVDADAGEASPCECRGRMIERARAKGVSATLPKRFRGVSFDRPPVSDMERDPNTRHQVAEVRAFTEEIDARLDEGNGLWLQGTTGTGKTTLAMLVSKAALDAGRTAAIYSLPQLLARIRRTFDGEAGEDSYFTFFNRLVSVDLLHLDDLGAENRTEWVLEQLYSIIDRRYNDQRSVVVTTNLEEPELQEQLGDRIVSRLTEICGDPLVLRGKDHRVHLAPPPPVDQDLGRSA
jgi:DNA replication protein DnaC